MAGGKCLHGECFHPFVLIFAVWAIVIHEASAQMTRVFQMQEIAQTNLYKNITIDRSFWVSSGAVFQGKLTDSSQLSSIIMDVTVTSNFNLTVQTFPLVSLILSAQIKDKDKDSPKLDVKISAKLLENITNVNSMNITIVSEIHPDLGAIKTMGFPMNWNYQLAWQYVGMKDFTVGYDATPGRTSKLIYRTSFNITDYQQRIINEFYDPLNTFFCLNQMKILELEYKHGYNMLMCLAGLIFAFILVLLFAIIRLIYRDNAISYVSYHNVNHGDLLILTPLVQGNSYQYAFQQYEKTDSSIVNVLMMDHTRIDREIIYRGLSSTERLENEMETIWCNGSSEIILSLLRKLENERCITKEMSRKAINSFQSKLAEMEKQLEMSYKSKLQEMKKNISLKNQKKIAELKAETEKVINNAKKNNCKPEVITMLEKEENLKLQNLRAELQLSEREELACLNKDTNLERRINYKTVQKDIFQLLRENSDLEQEKQEWYMRENEKRQKEWSNEIEKNKLLKQLASEEKMVKQEVLAEQTDAQDLDHEELLDNIATQQISILKTLKKKNIIPQSEAKIITEEVMDDLKEVKNTYVEKKMRYEKELAKKLNQEKIANFDEIRARQKLELEELEKKYKKDLQEGKTDPLSHMNEKQKLESQNYLALEEAESEMDEKHAHQLQKTRDNLMAETKQQLETMQKGLTEKLKEKGASEEHIEDVLLVHRQRLNALQQEQSQNQKKQNDLMMERIARLKEERKKRAEEEKDSQQQVQEYEKNLVKELLDSQFTMSENNRDKIWEEHEKQMIKLDNSLTLNKIRQQQLLEKKLAKKREEKLNWLKEKQLSETSANQRPSEDAVEEVDNSKFIEKHVKERLAVLQESVNRSTALEEIETSLNEERAEALKHQEEELAAQVAKLKLDKIKERCEIEEKEKAILKLKANLIDELHSSGCLEDSQCSDMIEEHNEQKKAFRQLQEEEKKKQQEVLRGNLQKQMLKRQETIVQKHESEIRNALMDNSDHVASKMKKLVLKNNQRMEMEKLRNEMERKMNQTLEEAREKKELEIKKQLQEKELMLITKMIKLGKLKRGELEKVLQMLLPGKSPKEIAQLLNKIVGKDTGDTEQQKIRVKTNEQNPRVTYVQGAGTMVNDVVQRNPLRRDNLQASNKEQDYFDEHGNDRNYRDRNDFYDPPTLTSLTNAPDIRMGRNGLMNLTPVSHSPLEDAKSTPKRKKKKKKKKTPKDTFSDSET